MQLMSVWSTNTLTVVFELNRCKNKIIDKNLKPKIDNYLNVIQPTVDYDSENSNLS